MTDLQPVDLPGSWRRALPVWTRIGLLSFGGPTAQIALMHRTLVEEKKWLSESQFLNALSFCMLLPGPEAMQLATYSGWRMHGIRGGLAAGLMFVLPGALVILALAMIYAVFGEVAIVSSLFLGIKAAVLIIVIEALLRIAKRTLHQLAHWIIAGSGFIAIFFLNLPFPLIIAAAAIAGMTWRKPANNIEAITEPLPRKRDTLRTIALWMVIWFAPLFLIAALVGPDHVFTQIGIFASKLAVVTFGGAYAVLAYMAQDVVGYYHWLTAGEMMDGLGLAETTPGPLILVTEFVGFLAAYGKATSAPLIFGLLGALITLWATFVPCFMWIFAGAPYIEHLNGQPRLKAALTGITAAVVGVILNLALWFALHVFFKSVSLIEVGIFRIWRPDFGSLDWRVGILSLLSAFLLLRRHWDIPRVLVVAALSATGLQWMGF